MKFCGIFVWLVDCRWGNWKTSGECTKTCGGGTIKYTRKVEVEAKDGGIPCIGRPTGNAPCNTQICKSNETALL